MEPIDNIHKTLPPTPSLAMPDAKGKLSGLPIVLRSMSSEEIPKGLSSKKIKHHSGKAKHKLHAAAKNLLPEATRMEEPLTPEIIFKNSILDSPKPLQLSFSHDGKRLTFLKPDVEAPDIYDLWQCSTLDGTSSILLKGSSLEAFKGPEKTPIFKNGVTDYLMSPHGQGILLSQGLQLYYYDLTLRALSAIKLLEENPAGISCIKFSPKGTYVSFVSGQDIHLADISTSEATQLTYIEEDSVFNGIPDYIARQEMGREDGYWWSPNEEFLAFFQIEDSELDQFFRFHIQPYKAKAGPSDNDFGLTIARTPMAGRGNTKTRLGIIEIATGRIRFARLGDDPEAYYPRCQWIDSHHIAVQVLARDHKKMHLFSVHFSGEAKLLMTRYHPLWINVNDDLAFLRGSKAFIWSWEQDHVKQLCLFDMDGRLIREITPTKIHVSKLLDVDEDSGIIYFDGYDDDPLEQHLFRVSLDGNDMPKKITHRHGWHETELCLKYNCFLDSYSGPKRPPRISLNRLDGRRICYLEKNKLDPGHPYHPYLSQHSDLEYGVLPGSDGLQLYYSIIKPKPFDPDKKHPVLITVQGAPGSRSIKKNWQGTQGCWRQYMARKGYVIFSLDSRGTSGRGMLFEGKIYGQLGKAEVEDQKIGVDFLRTLPFVDAKRIGVIGWGYGGYLTLMMLMKASDYFHAGIAISPMTDWKLYNPYFAEKFLGSPQENQEAYEKSSVFSHADGLKGPLMIAYGLSDETAATQNALSLIQTLQAKNKYFESMAYPGSRYTVENHLHRHLHEQCIAPFFDRHLRREPA